MRQVPIPNIVVWKNSVSNPLSSACIIGTDEDENLWHFAKRLHKFVDLLYTPQTTVITFRISFVNSEDVLTRTCFRPPYRVQ